ncbi:hypothetical protein E4U09_005230 [Claviceps aff. purpurea]|uniref:Small ribosomal subunit protein mS41 n=1 Tax=Claviceps aff. purpurea TaxID=1967640 RepID=A0A9P7U427_9HYPO|nr:hypothetical protein E4U09_005230 [Claviceps aff. purpurea]
MSVTTTLRASLRLLAPKTGLAAAQRLQIRFLHKSRPLHPIPKPCPFVPDVPTFLTLIGRGLSKHASKFSSWENLFSATSSELKEMGIEPPRARRYLLQWMNKYRIGALGPGGDFEHVEDGQALLKVATPPASVISDAKWVVNVPSDPDKVAALKTLPRPLGYKVVGLKSIRGPYALPLPGTAGSTVKVTEGMWEDRQSEKVDGGERRRAEVRFKRRVASRKENREKALSSESTQSG